MALNWNETQARISARAAVLAGRPVGSAPPTQVTPLGAVSKIPDVTAEKATDWRIEGVSPAETDVITGSLPPPPEKPPVWPSKTRPPQFTVVYDGLNSALDATLISEKGLVQTSPGKWTQLIAGGIEESEF